MTALRLRPMTPSDLPVASALAADLLRLHHAWDEHRFLAVDDPAAGYARFFEGELGDDDAVLLVAERAGAVVGYAYGRVEPRDWQLLLDRAGHLHDLFVADGARGSGVGEALVRAMLAAFAARGVPRVVLHTATQNEAGQRLFARAGFRATMVEMTCDLPPAAGR